VSRAWTYRATRHDPGKPWIIVETTELQSIDLADGANFWEWASEHWPGPEWSVTLEPPGQEHAAVLERLNRHDS
jgi:hypothetical protein